jgi:hypothetical protein
MKVSSRILLVTIAVASLTSCKKNPYLKNDQSQESLFETTPKSAASSKEEAIVVKAHGDINDALSQFRDLLGGGQPNTAPGAVGGRREINWDAVPDNLTNNNAFPGDFFGSSDPAAANGRKRGLIMTTPGTGFSISDTNFFNINQTYGDQFKTFSPRKTFVPIGSTITDNFFKIPGTNTDASVHGFGVVFSDVNNESSTSMEFYDGERLLGSFKVPNNGNNEPGAFSFLGVYFPNANVTRVRIYSGSDPLSSTQNDISDGGGEDLVIMDDFIYSEPAN